MLTYDILLGHIFDISNKCFILIKLIYFSIHIWSTLLYLIKHYKKSLLPLFQEEQYRGKDKLTAVIKIKYKAWAKPSSETTCAEIICCPFINFKRGVRGQ